MQKDPDLLIAEFIGQLRAGRISSATAFLSYLETLPVLPDQYSSLLNRMTHLPEEKKFIPPSVPESINGVFIHRAFDQTAFLRVINGVRARMLIWKEDEFLFYSDDPMDSSSLYTEGQVLQINHYSDAPFAKQDLVEWLTSVSLVLLEPYTGSDSEIPTYVKELSTDRVVVTPGAGQFLKNYLESSGFEGSSDLVIVKDIDKWSWRLNDLRVPFLNETAGEALKSLAAKSNIKTDFLSINFPQEASWYLAKRYT